MNDIEILQEMLSSKVQVPLQQGQGRPSVELTETQNNTTVKIKGLPHDSIVIKADAFPPPKIFFKGVKKERKRADFVIVSNMDTKKWIICIEIKENKIRERKVIPQLRGARCVMDYCTSVGREFWAAKGFLQGYDYRFVGIVRNSNKQPMRLQSKGKLHSFPENFLQIAGQSHHFSKLI